MKKLLIGFTCLMTLNHAALADEAVQDLTTKERTALGIAAIGGVAAMSGGLAYSFDSKMSAYLYSAIAEQRPDRIFTNLNGDPVSAPTISNTINSLKPGERIAVKTRMNQIESLQDYLLEKTELLKQKQGQLEVLKKNSTYQEYLKDVKSGKYDLNAQGPDPYSRSAFAKTEKYLAKMQKAADPVQKSTTDITKLKNEIDQAKLTRTVPSLEKVEFFNITEESKGKISALLSSRAKLNSNPLAIDVMSAKQVEAIEKVSQGEMGLLKGNVTTLAGAGVVVAASAAAAILTQNAKSNAESAPGQPEMKSYKSNGAP